MPVKIIRQDITKLKVDAIVNTTNSNLDASGGLDHYIHQLAGKELDVECKYIIHTASPIWSEDNYLIKALLESCYN